MWLFLSARLFLSFNRIAANWFASRARIVWPHGSHLHVVLYRSNENCTLGFFEEQIPSPSLLLVLPHMKPERPSICSSLRSIIFRRSANSGNHGAENGAGIGIQFTSNSPEHPRKNS